MGQKKTIIITGASRGLGAATAHIAAGYGASVVLNARSSSALEEVATEIRQAGGEAFVSSGDIGQWDVCYRIIADAIGQFSRIDAIVNNGGAIEPIAPISLADPQEWMRNWNVNALGPVMLVQKALPYLRKVCGRVINVSSGAAIRPIPGWGAYSMAKVAIQHFTGILAIEEPSITAIAIRPGVIDTEMQRTIREQGAAGMPAAEYERFVQRYKQGMLLPPELPGRAVASLALSAPHEWSGESIAWDDPRVQRLVADMNA
ncbi:MAG TPA: SDR family NAD(P)-dependent oxidoreductase [Anaerolineales bacterium]|nr:SDR family NAD(P)-dependent oxidoreductase [Anaerolineales bacterium]